MFGAVFAEPLRGAVVEKFIFRTIEVTHDRLFEFSRSVPPEVGIGIVAKHLCQFRQSLHAAVTHCRKVRRKNGHTGKFRHITGVALRTLPGQSAVRDPGRIVMPGIKFAKHADQSRTGGITVFPQPRIITGGTVADTGEILFRAFQLFRNFQSAPGERIDGLYLGKSGIQRFTVDRRRQQTVFPLKAHEYIHTAPCGIRSDTGDKKIILIMFLPDAFVNGSRRKKWIFQFLPPDYDTVKQCRYLRCSPAELFFFFSGKVYHGPLLSDTDII